MTNPKDRAKLSEWQTVRTIERSGLLTPLHPKSTPAEACTDTADNLRYVAQRFDEAAQAHKDLYRTHYAEVLDRQAHELLAELLAQYAPVVGLPDDEED